jgi:uracil-DNA glycosylase
MFTKMDALLWADLQIEVQECTKCKLSETRENVVFGAGNPNASIMLIGEGPGQREDELGIPFVGKSGELLDNILNACGFSRENHVFIGNIVKCRPPNNRDPLPEEKEQCIEFLYRQIEMINPPILVLLGRVALQGLIDPKASITKMRGEWIEWKGRLVMPTYHPSALLRNPKLKYDARDDFKKIVEKYQELVDSEHKAVSI